MQEPNLTMRGNTMAVDNTNRFTGKAELYVQARPRYADALFSYMKEDLQLRIGGVVADVGIRNRHHVRSTPFCGIRSVCSGAK